VREGCLIFLAEDTVMKLVRATFVLSLILAGTIAGGSALAGGGGSGGGGHGSSGGGGHGMSGGGGNAHFSGGGHPHSGFSHRGNVRFFVGGSFFWPWFYYPPYYSYPPNYYDPAYYYYPPDYSPMAVTPSPVYVEEGSTPPAPVAPQSYWYYCANSKTYYPYVKECPAGWQRVSPQPPS